MKMFYGHRVAANYRSLIIWEFGKSTKSLISTTVVRPLGNLSRKEKYFELSKAAKSFGITIKTFNPTRS